MFIAWLCIWCVIMVLMEPLSWYLYYQNLKWEAEFAEAKAEEEAEGLGEYDEEYDEEEGEYDEGEEEDGDHDDTDHDESFEKKKPKK